MKRWEIHFSFQLYAFYLCLKQFNFLYGRFSNRGFPIVPDRKFHNGLISGHPIYRVRTGRRRFWAQELQQWRLHRPEPVHFGTSRADVLVAPPHGTSSPPRVVPRPVRLSRAGRIHQVGLPQVEGPWRHDALGEVFGPLHHPPVGSVRPVVFEDAPGRFDRQPTESVRLGDGLESPVAPQRAGDAGGVVEARRCPLSAAPTSSAI